MGWTDLTLKQKTQGYDGTEEGLPLDATTYSIDEGFFEVRAPTIPDDAVPVFDDEMSAVVGYKAERFGVVRYYDLNGDVVGMEERGLESPLLDPLDLIMLVGGAIRAIGKGIITGTVKTGTRVAATRAGTIAASRLAVTLRGAMRAALKGLSPSKLKFTATTLNHMREAGRRVPLHIFHLAIKYGKRGPDPQGAKNAFRYTVDMWRNGAKYSLEVVVRESDWTILHFLYK